MPDEPELSFEQALTQIERIVVNLERGEPDLTTALTNYEKGGPIFCHRSTKLVQSAALLTGTMNRVTDHRSVRCRRHDR